MLWKTEEKVLPEEKRDEDSGKLMLTGRSVEVRSQGKGLWNAGSGASKGPGWLAHSSLLMLYIGSWGCGPLSQDTGQLFWIH